MNAQPVLDVVHVYVAAGEGYILFDHGVYTPTELARDVVEFALEAGFGLSEQDADAWEFIDEDVDRLYWLEDEAIDYLNTHHCPEGGWWGHDGDAGAFGCWPVPEEDES